MNMQFISGHHKWSRLILALVALALVLGFGTVYAVRVAAHSCKTVTSANLELFNPGSYKDLVSLARGLGAAMPVSACTGDVNGMLTPDGYQAWVIRTPKTTHTDIEKFGCPVRSFDDQSNPQKVTFVHQAYSHSGKVTNYYSGEGKCSGGGPAAIVDATDDEGNSAAYIIFYARHAQ